VILACNISNIPNIFILFLSRRTFHKPVITPFELELGLGAREWGSTFSTDLGVHVVVRSFFALYFLPVLLVFGECD